ncbi:hypothetical protein B296_00004837 [Ensete ventricosum]|uniref:VHS domain-containing protein n=1 Tax=Ensete ventricosum TaxID=4639 RepID=A0A427AIY9_ENSVE|nr:hypothetical protein B296_00004837 [Ensete ventricosum]
MQQAKEVLKAVKKRLQNKNSKVQFLALTVCAKLVKSRYKSVKFILQRLGIVFPQRPANTPPILTPPVTRLALTSGHGQEGYGVPSITSTRLDETMATDIGNLRDEKLLGEALELNDSLQSLLAKHEAIASGSPLLHEQPKSLPQAKEPIEHPVASSRTYVLSECRNSKFKQATSANSSDLSPNRSDVTRVTESSTSSSAMSNALVPLDPPPPPPPPAKTQKEAEQDMIDLLSITLATYPSPPQTPVTPPSASSQQGYAPHDSYVAPWAQQALPAPPQPSPSWAAATDANPSPFWSAPSSAANAHHAANLPAYSPPPLHPYNSFGSRINGTTTSVAARETPVNSTPRQSGTPASPKPYVLPNRLFEDLIDLRSTSTGQKTSARAASNQPMIGGKKK